MWAKRPIGGVEHRERVSTGPRLAISMHKEGRPRHKFHHSPRGHRSGCVYPLITLTSAAGTDSARAS